MIIRGNLLFSLMVIYCTNKFNKGPVNVITIDPDNLNVPNNTKYYMWCTQFISIDQWSDLKSFYTKPNNNLEDKFLKMIITIGAYFYFSSEGKVTSVKTLGDSPDGKGLIFTSSLNDTRNGYFYLLQDAPAELTDAYKNGAQVEASLQGLEGIYYTYLHKPPKLMEETKKQIMSPPMHNIHGFQGGFVYMKNGMFIWHPIGEAKKFKQENNKAIGLLQSEVQENKHFEQNKLCQICFTKVPHFTILPCGHMFCSECCDAMLGQQISMRNCYRCGNPVTHKAKIM